jgi:hypothetical protein
MPVVVTQSDRQSFLRCRRQWDLGARMRRDLEPAAPAVVPDLAGALHAALAVYYFPGMWDWDRAVTIPLVLQGFDREISRQRERGVPSGPEPAWPRLLEAGHRVLERYFAWAPQVDRFSPVLIESDFDVQVPDPARTGAGLTGPDREAVRFRGRIDMLAVDEHDAYWLVRHEFLSAGWRPTGELPGGWPPTEESTADAAALTAAWAWEQFYPGLAIAGTIHNEVLLPSAGEAAEPGAASPPEVVASQSGPGWSRRWSRQFRGRGQRPASPPEPAGQSAGSVRPLVRQHEPSGGGRSIPQHRRLYARASEPADAAPVEQVTSGGFRRTWVRHSPAAIAEAGLRLGADTAAMLTAGAAAEPNPSDANCRPCAFLPPCLAMRAGRDSEFLLRSGYRARPPDRLEEGRLGGGAWGMGRGAAPFRGG